ncbi:MAG: TfoX/Sxy family protein [Candidatus Paceibacterota bacterium]
MQNKTFHDYVVGDLLSHMEGLGSRAMFGGYGLYLDGIIFGIIAEDALYLKVDDTNRKEYESFGSSPFTYQKKEKEYAMSYWVIPEEIMENRERLAELIMQSVHIQKQSKKKKLKR